MTDVVREVRTNARPPVVDPGAIAEILKFPAVLAAANPQERSLIFEQLIQTLEQTQFIFRFDWPQWIAEAQRLTQQPTHLTEADLLTLRKLMTVYVRTHRFYPSYLNEHWDEGQLQAIFERLSQLVD